VYLPKDSALPQYKIVVPDVGGISLSAVVKADVCETRTIRSNEYSVFEKDQKYIVTLEGEKESSKVVDALNITSARVMSTKTSLGDLQKQMAAGDFEQAGSSVRLHEKLSKAKEALREAEAEHERLSLWREAKDESGGWQIQSEKLKFEIACKASELWYDVTTVVEGKTHTPQMQAGRIGLEPPLQDGQRLFMSKHKRYKIEHNLNNSSLQASKDDGQNAIVRNVTIAGQCEVEYMADGEKKDGVEDMADGEEKDGVACMTDEEEKDGSSLASSTDKLPTNVVEASKIYELNPGLKDLQVDDAKVTKVPHYNLRDHVLELSTPLEPPFSVGCWLHWPPNTAGKEPLIVLFSSCKNEKVKDWVVVDRSTGLIGLIDIEIGTDFKPVTKVWFYTCVLFLSNARPDIRLLLSNPTLRLLSLQGGILLASPYQPQIRRQMSTKGKVKAISRCKNRHGYISTLAIL
jgi:hypothetical protein